MAASPAMAMLRSMVATSAIHDGDRDEKDDYTRVCHPGTREDHLRDLMAWARNIPLATRVEWLNAIAGAGKTAILRTFCAELEEQSSFPSISFFVWQGDARRNNLKLFPATIAAQLCRRIPALVPYVEKAINEDSFLLQSAFKKQMDKLVIRPLLDASDAIKSERHLIIVVDGLDELDEKSISDFLSFIPYLLQRLSSLPISLLVSSRPDAEIVAAFKRPALASITRSTRLGASDEDIWRFINAKFDDINIRYPLLQVEHGGMWPTHVQRAIMVFQSSGLFIWPTVAIDYIDKVKLGLSHNQRLEHVLSSAEPKPWIASPLDNLYRAILQAHAPENPESVDFLRFKRRLALLCLPVYLQSFVWRFRYRRVLDWSGTPVRIVFDETPDELSSSVTGLSSLFSHSTPPSERKSATPTISHRSFRDFTFNRARCGDKLYYCSERELHAEVVCKLLNFFSTRQAYQVSILTRSESVAYIFIAKSIAEMSGVFIRNVGSLLEFHLKEAAVSEQLVTVWTTLFWMLFHLPGLLSPKYL